MGRVIREATPKLGKAKGGTSRFWAEGKYLRVAGFLPGMFLAFSAKAGAVEIRPSEAPTKNIVSQKDHGETSVIDVTGGLIAEHLGAPGTVVRVRVEEGRIIITRTPRAERVAARLSDGSVGEICAGGGLAGIAARRAGLTPRFAVEIEPHYAEIHEGTHPGAVQYVMAAEDAALLDLPSVETLLCGPPCEPFSRGTTMARGTGGQKRDRTLPATAHDLGHVTMVVAMIVARTNPRTVIIENSPSYAKSETAYALIGFLKAYGYHVEMRVLSPHDAGFLADRARTFIVGMTPAADGSVPNPWPALRPLAETERPTVASILDADVPAEAWWTRETKRWLFDHNERQQAKGNGFKLVEVTPASTRIPSMTKRYLAERGDQPALVGPDGQAWRWFTATEFARIMGLRDGELSGTSKTRTGEALGQGWHVGLTEQIIGRATGRYPSDRFVPVGAVGPASAPVPDAGAAAPTAPPALSLFAMGV